MTLGHSMARRPGSQGVAGRASRRLASRAGIWNRYLPRLKRPDQSRGWTLTFSAAGLTSGMYTLFAQAEDNYHLFGDPLALTETVS
jgi:hypothetical protein